MFLTTITHETIHGNKIGCIILCHGDSTASSMSSVVNELLSTNHCKAIDMPLDSSVKDTLNKTIKMVNAIDEGKGVVLLSDMGTLTAFSEIITQKTKIHTHSVEMVSTPIALEIVRKCMLPEMTLEKLIDEVDNISPYIGRSLTTEMVNDQLITKDKVIITVCVTGKGSAAKIAQLIESNLSSIQENNIKLIPVNIDEFKKEIVKIGSHKKEIIAIVGTLNIKTELPFISIDEIVFGNGLEKLNKIIWETSEGLNTKVAYTKFDSSDKMYIELLCRFLNFMSPDKVYHLGNIPWKYYF